MKNIIEIKEEVNIPGTDVVLEKGDKIELLTEMEEEYMYMDFGDMEPELRDFYAKKLSSEWYDGMGDPLYALASTGAIIDGVEDSIMNGVEEAQARDFLINYVTLMGDRGPQRNWDRIRW